MNKYQKDFLSKCKKVKIFDDLPLFDSIYVMPTNRKHDSGYKMMIVVGYENRTQEYYLLDTFCDVVDFAEFYTTIKDLHVDIPENGIIRYWSRYHKFKSIYRVSSCTFEMIDKK